MSRMAFTASDSILAIAGPLLDAGVALLGLPLGVEPFRASLKERPSRAEE